MPTFGECIVDGIATGAIPAEIGQAAHEAYQNAYADAAQTLGPDEADRQAGTAVLGALEMAKIEAQRRQALTVRNRRAYLADVRTQKLRRGYQNVPELGGSGGKPPPGGPEGWTQGGAPPPAGPLKGGVVAARVLRLLMRNKAGRGGFAGESAEGQAIAVKGMLDAQMAKVMEAFSTRTGFDRPNRALLINVVREAFGEDTGDAAAKELAAGWSAAAEQARQWFNVVGGRIGKLDKWGLPQLHAADRVYAAGKAGWIQSIAPLLDRAKMVDNLTGAPITLERLTAPDGVLSQVYDRIVTHGLIDAYPPDHPGAGALALTRGEERFLIFKDADSWMAYQREFGQGDAYAAMVNHLDGMAKDIGLMRVLGPNPAAEWRWRVAFAQREAAIERLHGNAGAVDKARSEIAQAQNMWDHYTGKASMPVNQTLARFGSGLRNFLNGVDLGSAIVSDMPSAPFFGAVARRLMGINGDVGQFVGLLADPEMRAIARRSGFINEAARDSLIGAAQDTLRTFTLGEHTANGANVFARKLPAAVMRLQGLTASFEARRSSFRLSFMGALHDAADRSLADLAANGSDTEKALAAELGRRGFSEADWEAIRQTPAWEPRKGVRFLRPQDIAQHANLDLGLRVGEMVVNGEQFAVPVSGSLWTRGALLGQARPGTLLGEGMRSFWMFKTFVVNSMYQYGEETFLRGVEKGYEGAGLNAWLAAHAAGYVGVLTLSGMATVQLKRLILGEDPLPLDDPRTWGAALIQGGGLGIWGDFLFSKTARTGKDLLNVGLGPVADFASDVEDLTVGEALDLATAAQHPKRHDREVQRLAGVARKYTPGATLWWSKTAFNRLIVEQLEQRLDPAAKQRYQQAATRQLHDDGAGSWWPRGSTFPERAPDFAHLVAAQDASQR